MEKVYKEAQKTFKYFWQELSWEYRRIVPALEIAMVKVEFTDNNSSDAEHMWINQINFDGTTITGVLINQPNWLTNVQEGDFVSIGMEKVCDWLIKSDSKVCGAFTVNALRKEMSDKEREEHDEAWQIDFGDPDKIELTLNHTTAEEHPMSLNMLESLEESLKNSLEILEYRDENGGTMLHYEALAGNTEQVKILLKHRLDKEIANAQGLKAIDLAEKMAWEKVVLALQDK